MRIAFVLHEADWTAVPMLGLGIARSLADRTELRLFAQRPGPAISLAKTALGGSAVRVAGAGAFAPAAPFAARVARARAELERTRPDLVYANSIAASDFVAAAQAAGIPVVLHLHEREGEIRDLLRAGRTRLDMMSTVDGLVLAAGGLVRDAEAVFAVLPQARHEFGVGLDAASVVRGSEASPGVARSASGRAFTGTDRLVVGMVGTASARAGADIFLETATSCPNADFVWIGEFAPEAARGTTPHADLRGAMPPNLYVAPPTDNPYPLMRRFDMLFLSSREDANPLVLAEASVLGVTILAFTATTSVADQLGRHAILCHGAPNAADAARVIQACSAGSLRTEEARARARRYSDGADIRAKIGPLHAFLERVVKDAARGIAAD